MKRLILSVSVLVLLGGVMITGCSRPKPVDDTQVVKHTPGEAQDDGANGQGQAKSPK